MVQTQEWIIALTAAHKSELLAVSALEQLVSAMPSRDPRKVLSTSLAVHSERAVKLATLLESSGSSQVGDVEIPARLQSMLAKKNVPERLMFAWLHEFESRLLSHYEETAATCPGPKEQLFFEKLLAEQRDLVEKTWDVTQRLTAVIDPDLWEDHTQFPQAAVTGGHDDDDCT